MQEPTLHSGPDARAYSMHFATTHLPREWQTEAEILIQSDVRRY